MVKWILGNDAALIEKYDARRAAGRLRYDVFELPSGRTLTTLEARYRRSRLKGAFEKRRRAIVIESDTESDATPPPAKPTRSQCSKWSPEDEAALVKKYDARRAAGWARAEAFVLPSGRTLTAAQARNRRSHLKMTCVQRHRVVVPDPKSDAASPPLKRKRRITPIKKRAAAVEVLFAPTPVDLRAVVDDMNASPAARNAARKDIIKHQQARLYRVKTAEAHNKTALVRQELSMCERAGRAVSGWLCNARRMLKKVFARTNCSTSNIKLE